MSSRRRESLFLLAVVLVAGAILVWLGQRQYVGYDSFWHVFIGRQETWALLKQEIAANAHPPLYYVVLGAVSRAFGSTLLVYRLVSIVSVLASIPLVAGIVRRLTGRGGLGVVAGAAFGLSAAAVEVGLEVRAYALLLAFLLTAHLAWLEWLESEADEVAPRTRALFAVSLCLALVTHYSSFFFLGATFGTMAMLALLDGRWRTRLWADVRRHPFGVTAMYLPPLAGAVGAYVLHARSWQGRRLNHVPEFMYDATKESVPEFLARTTKILVVSMTPELGAPVVLSLTFGLALAGLWLIARRHQQPGLGFVSVIFFGGLLFLNAAAGLASRYPYGGERRHAIFLFPFAVIALFSVLDGLRRVALKPTAEPAWLGTLGVAVASSAASWLAPYPIEPTLMKAQLDRFHLAVGRPPGVLVDQFNFILIYGLHHDWSWKLEWQDRDRDMWQVWRVSRGDEQFQVCRSVQWLVDFTHPGSGEELLDCLERTSGPSVALFRPAQPGLPPTWPIADAPRLAAENVAPFGLVAERVVPEDGVHVYALFRRAAPVGARITIREATYGTNCGAPPGNATAHASAACDGRGACRYKVDSVAVGDVKYGCEKDLTVKWTCGDDLHVREARAAPESSFKPPLALNCTVEAQP